jgi:hypothetical protein
MGELHQLQANVLSTASRLGQGDAVKFEQHFKDHRDLLMKATGKHFPVSSQGEVGFLTELRNLVATRRLQLVGAATLAKDQPIVYVLRGFVGVSQLTLIMKTNGDFQTLIRAGEGLDLKMRMILRFDTPNPFVFAASVEQMKAQQQNVLAELKKFRQSLKGQVETYEGEHKAELDLYNNTLAGFAVNRIFNPNVPQIQIWGNAHGSLKAAETALRIGNGVKALGDLLVARSHFLVALRRYCDWKDGISRAGAKTQLAIGATAVGNNCLCSSDHCWSDGRTGSRSSPGGHSSAGLATGGRIV